jgi:hypothetical protein
MASMGDRSPLVPERVDRYHRTGMESPGVPSVTVENVDDSGTFLVKIATDHVEMNVWVQEADLPKLAEVRGRRWELGALRIGRSAGTPAWWSVEAEEDGRSLSIVVGDDDESWDLNFRFPLETLDAILREIDACRP